jgi:hypothetical protein
MISITVCCSHSAAISVPATTVPYPKNELDPKKKSPSEKLKIDPK